MSFSIFGDRSVHQGEHDGDADGGADQTGDTNEYGRDGTACIDGGIGIETARGFGDQPPQVPDQEP